jgi:hypothetical protein
MILTYARFMTEVVYIPIFLLSYYLLERVLDSGRIRDAAWAGALSGAASLTRSISFLFTLITAVWLLVRKFPASKSFRGRIVLAAVLTAGLFVVLSPWAIRNTITHGAPILVSNDTAFNLWLVISGRQIKDVTPEWRTWGTQAERQAEAYRRWSAKLREDPTFHFRRLGETLPRVFDGNWIMPAGALSMIRRGYGNRDLPTLGAFLRVFAPALFFLVSVGGIIGIAVVERDATRRNLVLIALVYFVLVHAATLFRPRFLLPVQMLLAIYAAGLIDRGLSRLGWTMPDRRRGS